MADEATLPTVEEIARLPRWARVAFAARCARRSLPLFRSGWPDAPAQSISILEEGVQKLESSAGQASITACEGFGDVDIVAAASSRAPIIAQHIVRGVAAAVRAIHDTTHYRRGASAAAAAKHIIAVSPQSVKLISDDFHHLLDLSQNHQWTDDTPVPPSVFGPLDEPTAKAFTLEAFAPEGTPTQVIGDSLVKLWQAANEYHMARGGGVLTFDEFKQMMPALVPVGPKSEG